VTRPGKWGNPFAIGEPVERGSDLWPYAMSAFGPQVQRAVRGFGFIKLLRAEDAVEAHWRWFVEQPNLMLTAERELGGRDLACWCKPGAPCHADFLLALANGWDEVP
jgi:hypothetical protein